MKKTAKLGILATALIIASSAFTYVLASSPLTATSGTITVNVVTPPGIVITSATLGTGASPPACTVTSGGQSISCPNSSLSVGNGATSETLTINTNNPAAISQSIPAPTWTFTSSGTNTSSFMSIAVGGTYPATLAPGSSGVSTFTITATAGGSDSFTLTL